jgi:hypothetical protein
MFAAKNYNRQQTMHLLPVPFEISEHINSFCFYDVKTVACMKKMKELKKEICWKFTFANSSRVNYYGTYEDLPPGETADNCEHWSVDLGCDDMWFAHERQFQATNCKCCGNYKSLSIDQEYPNRIRCNCSGTLL